jgi:hypothetical protein
MLAKRLTRRGLTLSAAALAAGLGPQATAAALSSSLVLATVKAGTVMLVSPSAAGVVSAQVAALSETVVRTLFLAKLKLVTALLLVGSVFAVGVGAVASGQLGITGFVAQDHDSSQASGARSGGDPANRPAATSPLSGDASMKTLLQQALETAGTVADPYVKIRILLRIADVQ